MADEADLKLKVDTTSLSAANYSFSEFQRNAQGASNAVRDHSTEMDRLTRSITAMVQQQRETNSLLVAGITAQRSSTQALDDHISSLTRLSAGINAANLAYTVFHKTSVDGFAEQARGVQQLAQSYQQLIGTLDQLAAKMASVNQASRPTGIPGTLGVLTPSATGFGTSGAIAGEIYAAITPAISQVLTPQLQQMYQAIQGQAARSSIDIQTLLKGINTGSQAGFGPEAGADMVTKMQHALTDLGQAAEFQRQALHDYGITTRDANEALRQFVTVMGKTQDSVAKTQTIAQFGLDPAMFTQTAAARLNPPAGSQAELAQRQQADIARLQQINSQLIDQVNAQQVGRTRTAFGLLPAAGSIITGGQYSSGQYEEVRNNLLAQQGAAGSNLMQGNIGAGIGGLASSEWALLINKLSSIVGASPNYGAVQNPNPLDQARTPPQVLQEIEDFSRSTGRYTPQGITAQIGRAQRRGQSLLDTLGTNAPEYDQAKRDVDDSIAFLAQRLKRINDPLEVFAENLDRETALLNLPANQRRQAGIISQAEQQQFLATGQRTSPQDRLQLTTSLGMQTAAEFTDQQKEAQHQLDLQKELAAAYAAGGQDIQKIIAAEKEYQAAKKSGFDASQQAAAALMDVKKALADLETQAQDTMQRARVGNVLSGNVAAAGGNPAAQRQAEIRNQALTKLNYFDRYNQAAGSGNYADIAQLNKELDQLTQTLGVDLANQTAAGRSSTLFQGQQTISGMTGALNGPGGDLQRQQAAIRARAALTASGAPFTEGQVGQLANQDLQKKTLESVTALTEEVEARKALLPFEQQHAAAIMAGVPAEKEFADNLKIAADIQKLMSTATKDQLPLIEKLNKELTEQAANERKVNQAVDQAKIMHGFDLSQQAAGRAISGFYAGGPQGMRLAEQAEPYRQSLIDAGMPANQADAQAKAMAMMAEKANDTKMALQDAATTMSTTMKEAVSDMVNGLTSGIGQSHALRKGLMDAALQISKLGLNMFVTKPLQTLADNVASGRGFNFNVGNSGLSYTSALGAAAHSAFSGLFGNDSATATHGSGLYSSQTPHGADAAEAGAIGKGADLAVGAYKASSAKDDSPSFLSSLFGGNKTAVGRMLNGTSGDTSPLPGASGANTGEIGNSAMGPTDLTGGLRPNASVARRSSAAVVSPGAGARPDWANRPAFGTPGFPTPGGFPQLTGSPEHANTTFDSSFSSPATAGDSVYHSGGLVIRKLHDGDYIEPPGIGGAGLGLNPYGLMRGLAHDEVPAILQTGERVLNRQETSVHDALFPNGITAAASPANSAEVSQKWAQFNNATMPPSGVGDPVINQRLPITAWWGSGYSGYPGDPGMARTPSSSSALGSKVMQLPIGPGGDWHTYVRPNPLISMHRGGLVRRFHDGGEASVLDQMLGDDDKRGLGNWLGGPNLGVGGTQSGIGPQVGKVTTDRTMSMLGMIVGKLGGLGDLFKGGGGAGGDFSGGETASWAGDFAGQSIVAHEGGLIGATAFPRRYHDGGLAANEMPAILARMATLPAQSPPPAVATGRGQPGNTVINQNIYTPDANSFRASADQVAAASRAAHDRAARNT